MNYESLEIVELGKAEQTIEFVQPEEPEEDVGKSLPAVAPYVEFDE
jgi:hypothetical protein